MDGGSCESTAYNLWGVRAGAACLALGNYHNCDERGGIGPEQVDWNDFEGLVALLHELAAARARGSDAAGALRTRLQAGFERDANLLARSAARILERLEE
jgi:endoglucanase